jgi:hypothetical protein
MLNQITLSLLVMLNQVTQSHPENALEVCPQLLRNRAKNRKENQENTGKLHLQVMIPIQDAGKSLQVHQQVSAKFTLNRIKL